MRRRLAAAADTADLPIDVHIFLIEVILGDGCANIDSTRLAVAHRR